MPNASKRSYNQGRTNIFRRRRVKRGARRRPLTPSRITHILSSTPAALPTGKERGNEVLRSSNPIYRRRNVFCHPSPFESYIMRTIKMRLNQAELLPRQIRDTVHEGTMPHCKSLALSLSLSLRHALDDCLSHPFSSH